ncbi:hypothetical protein [Planococcus alpniumensis]|uniref:hypothetical protein n=1 Tax=Planococcus alpniumensis TaxID=2708345 RepID=UPI001B8C3140|nr:hypothetical protein [Planococcus sp. MSAK28401]
MQLKRQDVAFSAARVGGGVEPMCRKKRVTFVSPVPLSPPGVTAIRFISSFKGVKQMRVHL